MARIESEEHYPRMDDNLTQQDFPGPAPVSQEQSSQDQAYPGLNFASIAKKVKYVFKPLKVPTKTFYDFFSLKLIGKWCLV